MKKKLEAELISIAHRILKLKNKSDVEQLYVESRSLYEKLAILRFAEQQFADAKPTIGIYEVRDRLDDYGREDNAEAEAEPEQNIAVEKPAAGVADMVDKVANDTDTQNEPPADIADETNPDTSEINEAVEEEHEVAEVAEDDNTDETTEAEAENSDAEETTESAEESEAEQDEAQPETDDEASESKEPEPEKTSDDDFMAPTFELTFERKEDLLTDEEAPRQQITFDDLLGPNYSDPVFEKVSDNDAKVEFDGAADGERDDFKPEAEVIPVEPASADLSDNPYNKSAQKDGIGKTITFGLNDRIGFEKHLFGGSSEDMNRVVSQLTTFDTFEEAREFIDDMVRPDYNNWEGKDDYATRFMDIVERKFS